MNVVLYTFEAFNPNRYSDPWVAIVNARGEYDFSRRCGCYTGSRRSGEAGELVVFEPVTNQVYGWGQKDYRKDNNSWRYYSKWDGEKFIDCDRLGKPKEEKK